MRLQNGQSKRELPKEITLQPIQKSDRKVKFDRGSIADDAGAVGERCSATGDRGSCSNDVFESLAAMQLLARTLLFAQDDYRVYSRGPQSWKRACRSGDQEQCRY